MNSAWRPPLQLSEHAGRCRLTLVGVTSGHGATLQDAGADLIRRLEQLAVAARRTGFRVPPELGPQDPRLFQFLYELSERSARGDDIRDLVLGD
jgi:hypothetical protein